MNGDKLPFDGNMLPFVSTALDQAALVAQKYDSNVSAFILGGLAYTRLPTHHPGETGVGTRMALANNEWNVMSSVLSCIIGTMLGEELKPKVWLGIGLGIAGLWLMDGAD